MRVASSDRTAGVGWKIVCVGRSQSLGFRLALVAVR